MKKNTRPTVESGDGESAETAIVFTPCDRETRIAAERNHINEQFGPEGFNWHEAMHLTLFGGRSMWITVQEDGTHRHVYFDNTVSSEFD